MQLAVIFWDPAREICTLPFLNYPILWYSLLFAIGFLGGYLLFSKIMYRYLLQFPDLQERDCTSFSKLLFLLRHPATLIQEEIRESLFAFLKPEEKEKILQGKAEDSSLKEMLFGSLKQLFASPRYLALVAKDLSLKKILSSDSLQFPKKAAGRLFFEKHFSIAIVPLKKRAGFLADKLFVYMLLATVIGARMGHLLFYENISFYLEHPWEVFKVWQGGLASHGAAVAILIALLFFVRRLKGWGYAIGWRSLLDLVAMPTTFAAVFIRIGNFFNQEILGTPSQLPWAVVFGHPMDHSLPIARHPAQLYEAFFYLFVFVFLFAVSFQSKILLKKGRTIGLFLLFIFSFRFLIEFLKEEQSLLLPFYSFLEMGQILSIPFIILGFFFFFWRDSKQKYDSSLFS